MISYRQQSLSQMLGRFRRGEYRRAWLCLMSLLLLAQVLLPIQAHTRWAVNDQGQVIELCTLHGSVMMTLTRDGKPQPAAQPQQDDRTAAMSFSLLLAGALSAVPEIQLAWLALSTVDTPPAVIGTPTQRPLRLASIRAPPSLV